MDIGRYAHVSWTPENGNGTYLIGCPYSGDNTRTTTLITSEGTQEQGLGPNQRVDILFGCVDTFRFLTGPAVFFGSGLIKIPTLLGDVVFGEEILLNMSAGKTDDCFITAQDDLTKAISKMWTIELMPFDNTPTTL